MKKRLLAVSFVLVLVILVLLPQIITVKADNLILQSNGEIVLVILKDTGNVLGETTIKTDEPKHPTTAKPPSPPPDTAKTIPVTTAHTQTTIQITPPKNDDKKINAVITTVVTTQTHQSNTPSGATAAPSPSHTPVSGSTPKIVPVVSPVATTSPAPKQHNPSTIDTNSLTTTVIATKTVDQVVAQGKNGSTIFSISSGQANQLTIQEGSLEVTTSLPLQIDSLTHSLNVPSSTNKSTNLSVLPTEAMRGAVGTGLFNSTALSQAKISLNQDPIGINYLVRSQKKGKLFGLFDVSSPVQVKVSAQTGTVVDSGQSLLFSLFGGLIK